MLRDEKAHCSPAGQGPAVFIPAGAVRDAPGAGIRRCQALLKSDAGFTDEEIAEHVGCSDRTVRTLA